MSPYFTKPRFVFPLLSHVSLARFFSCQCTSTLFRFSSVSVYAFLFIPDFASARELVQSALNLSHPSFYSFCTLRRPWHTVNLQCLWRFLNSAHPSIRYPMLFREIMTPFTHARSPFSLFFLLFPFFPFSPFFFFLFFLFSPFLPFFPFFTIFTPFPPCTMFFAFLPFFTLVIPFHPPFLLPFFPLFTTFYPSLLPFTFCVLH